MTPAIIGCDPEVFVRVGGKVVPVCGLIGGTKDSPIKVRNGTLQEDNVMAEIGIDPCSHVGTAIERTLDVMDQLRATVSGELVISGSHVFSTSDLRHPQAWEFGCSPDFNAYTMRRNRSPNLTGGMRCAGGHLHYSCAPDHAALVAQMMDVRLGLVSVVLDRDGERRKFYGKAGAFRPKPYGGEYRVLSNFWLRNPDLMEWAYSTTQACVDEVDELDEHHAMLSARDVVRIINTGNYEEAKAACQTLNLQMP